MKLGAIRRAALAARAAGAGPRAHPDSVRRALPGHGARPRAARAGHRELSHVLRGVLASLRAAACRAPSCASSRAASPSPSATRSTRWSSLRRAMRAGAARLRRALPDAHHSDRHGDGALRRRRRRTLSRAARHRAGGSRCWCTSGASRTRRTSSSCFACSPASCAASRARCSSSQARGRRWHPARRTCARSGLTQHVRFVGYLSRERELLDCYRAGDLFVFSSKTETQGLVLLEVDGARRAGRFDGAHGDGGHRQPAARRASSLPTTKTEFASIVVRLLDDPPRRAAMSAEARAYAATWSAQRDGRPAGRTVLGRVVGQASRNSPVSQPV